ncbi:hypothetical protein QUF63_01310 [Anaerolineales bacterium HSG25]|nr:hypothetical protein [Anaerolineales bacterium HSG25]
MNFDEQYQKATLIGAVIGAIIGASAAYLLVRTPASLAFDEDAGYVKTKDLLDLTNTATSLIRQLDSVRKKT